MKGCIGRRYPCCLPRYCKLSGRSRTSKNATSSPTSLAYQPTLHNINNNHHSTIISDDNMSTATKLLFITKLLDFLTVDINFI
jgi:hypothetical protein